MVAPVDLARALAPLAGAVGGPSTWEPWRGLLGEASIAGPLRSAGMDPAAVADPACLGTRATAVFASEGVQPSPRLRELLSAAGTSFSPSADRLADLRAWFELQGGKAPPIDGAPPNQALLAAFTTFRGAEVPHAWRWWTQEGTFHLLDGTTRQVTMVEERREARIGHFESVRIVELPYGCEDLSLLLILPQAGEPEPSPRGGTGLGLGGLGKVARTTAEPQKKHKDPRQALRDAEAELSNLDQWVSALWPGIVNLSFPRFTIDGSADLSAPLAQMGRLPTDVSLAFEGSTQGIGAVAQQVVFTMDERSIRSKPDPIDGLGPRGPWADPAVYVTIDRPFHFAVRNTRSGAIHFMGRVVDPHDPIRGAGTR